MKFKVVVEVELDGLELDLHERLALEHKVQETVEDDLDLSFEDRTGKNEGKVKVNSNLIGPYDPTAEKHPLDLQIFDPRDGSDTIVALVSTPNHPGNRGSRVFITWPCDSDLVKDYGSAENFFKHIDSYLVNEKGEVDECSFVGAQRMGSDYTGWFEIPDVPE